MSKLLTAEKPELLIPSHYRSVQSKTVDSFCFGYPYHSDIRNEFVLSVANMIALRGDLTMEAMLHVRGTSIPRARNAMVKAFLDDYKADWLFMADVDIQFPPDAPDQLAKAAKENDAGIAAGLCALEDGRYNWFEGPDPHTVKGTIDSTKVYNLIAAGTGCIIVHRKVLTEMRGNYEGPWCWFDYDPWIGVEKKLSEDVAFCIRASKLGFKTIGVPWVRCGHVKTFLIWPAVEEASATET